MPMILPLLRNTRGIAEKKAARTGGALSNPVSGQQYLFPEPEAGVLAEAPPIEPFYLKTERLFADPSSKIQEKVGQGDQYLKWLKDPRRGISPAELKATGLEEFLSRDSREFKVDSEGQLPRINNKTREGVLNFLQDNPDRPEMERLVLGDPKTRPKEPGDTSPGALDTRPLHERLMSQSDELAYASRDLENPMINDRDRLDLNREANQMYIRANAEKTAWEAAGSPEHLSPEDWNRLNADPDRLGWNSEDLEVRVETRMDSDGDVSFTVYDQDDGELPSGGQAYYHDLDSVADDYGTDSPMYDAAGQAFTARDEVPVYTSEQYITRYQVLDEDGEIVDGPWTDTEGDSWGREQADDVMDRSPLDEDGGPLWEIDEEGDTQWEVWDDGGDGAEVFDNSAEAYERAAVLRNEWISNEVYTADIVEGQVPDVDDYIRDEYGIPSQPDIGEYSRGNQTGALQARATQWEDRAGGMSPFSGRETHSYGEISTQQAENARLAIAQQAEDIETARTTMASDPWQGLPEKSRAGALAEKQIPGQTKYVKTQYRERGGEHHTEELLQMPNLPERYSHGHWSGVEGGKNYVAHTRGDIRHTPDGESVTWGDEIQSDLERAAEQNFKNARNRMARKEFEDDLKKVLYGEEPIDLDLDKAQSEAANRITQNKYDHPLLRPYLDRASARLRAAGVTGHNMTVDPKDKDIAFSENWVMRPIEGRTAETPTGTWEGEYIPTGDIAFEGTSAENLWAQHRSLVASRDTRGGAYQQMQEVVEGTLGSGATGVPNNPFGSDGWRLLGFKNLLNNAVTDDTDFVAVTPGWMQSRRYHTDYKDREGPRNNKGELDESMKGDPRNPGPFTVPYERALPRLINKYLKKLGNETGERYQLERVPVNMEQSATGSPGTEYAWGLRLTPRLKEHIRGNPEDPLTGGQSLFSAAAPVGALAASQSGGEQTPYEKTKKAVGAFTDRYNSENIAPPGRRSFVEGGMNDLVQIAAGLENALALGAQGVTGVMGALEILGSAIRNKDQNTEEVLNRWQGYAYDPRSSQAERQQAVLMDLIRDNPKIRGTLELLGDIGPKTEKSILDTTGSRPLSHAGRAVLEMM